MNDEVMELLVEANPADEASLSAPDSPGAGRLLHEILAAHQPGRRPHVAAIVVRRPRTAVALLLLVAAAGLMSPAGQGSLPVRG